MAQPDEAHVDRLLLVDDNPTNLQVLYQALEDEGYELLVAQSGEEAITIASEATPQLILLDINMPGIDGYETCRRLKEVPKTREAVVVFLSARGETADKVKGFDVGAVNYIGKPFQFEEVVARVRKHLDTFHEHRELQERNERLRNQLSGGFTEFSGADLREMLARGESEQVEFKSTLRWNLHANKPDRRIENACLKTVAAYLNGNGGCLLVGVDDEGQPLGLTSDQFANEDKLLLHWNGLIKTCLGVEFTPYTRSTLHSIDQHRVLVVQCLTLPQPVFMNRDGDEAFYIRTGNGTQPLRPSELLAYLEQRHTDPQASMPTFSFQEGRLGQYTIEEKIGSGGMGAVYRARHAMLRRPAAVKVLDEERTNERTLARFEREVQLTSQLNHPNTIAIYDYGRTPKGVFYYVMEYLDGITLDSLVRSHGPQSEGRVIHILRQLCGSLAEAHSVGLIHRDLKPANMMLNYRGGVYDVVKLLDFGLVKAVDSQTEIAVTATGSITGTPLYLSPESIQHPQEVDARSDLYSLGAVGYWLLTGWPVFMGESALVICEQHVGSRPIPPAERRKETISDDLARLIMKCLEKSADDRPPTARALFDELSACQAADTWTQEEAARWWQDQFRYEQDKTMDL